MRSRSGCHISPRNEPLAFDRTAAAPSQAALTQRLSPGSVGGERDLWVRAGGKRGGERRALLPCSLSERFPRRKKERNKGGK